MTKQPIEFMFSPYRRELLARFLLRPDEQFHVRELARMTGISAGSLHRELTAMAESGFVQRLKRVFNMEVEICRACGAAAKVCLH